MVFWQQPSTFFGELAPLSVCGVSQVVYLLSGFSSGHMPQAWPIRDKSEHPISWLL